MARGQFQFLIAQGAERAFGQFLVQVQRADGVAVQFDDLVADCREHAFDLMVFALVDGEFAVGRVDQGEFGGAGGGVLVIQVDAVAERFRVGFGERFGEGDAVALGLFVIRRGDAVRPVAVGGQQDEAGGVDVEAAGDVQVLAPGLGDQIVDAGVVAIAAGADVAQRLVEHQVALADGGHGFVVEMDFVIRADVLFRIAAGLAVDVDPALADGALGERAAEVGDVVGEEAVEADGFGHGLEWVAEPHRRSGFARERADDDGRVV